MPIMTNLDSFLSKTMDAQHKMLFEYFQNWANIGDSYIFDLTRVKSAFELGTMSFDDFVEWDSDRISELVDEFLMWLYDAKKVTDGCADELRKLPSIEAEPVRHGRWIDGGEGIVVCSECGEEHCWEDYRAAYCDSCGAKMDGGKSDA